MKIGFVRLGSMGSAMARNLVKAGHEVIVYNRTRSRAEEFPSLGARVAGAPAEAATGVDVVFTMLADDSSTEAVVFGPGGILSALIPGSTHICSSTISVALSRRLAKAHEENRQDYIAAPVFGRPEAALAAKLFLVVAGPRKQVERCQPLFEVLGQKTFVIGDDGPAAHVIKITGNFLISTVIEALAEGFSLVRKSGIKANQFLDVMTNSLFSAPVYKTYGALLASEKFEPPGFKLLLGLKDNRLVMAAAEQAAVPMPLASLVHDRFLAAIAQGLSESDWSAIAKVSYRNAGL